ncbi:MAG: SAM-dependent methyltransferase [Turicibacter sp.]|nr:SAM-dependent methyltransferase [Turicibacter sp.]
MYRTEDEVRNESREILGFNEREKGIQQDAGQITTFNQLGFKGVTDKPDGWYLPDDASKVAIILETKSEIEDISKEKWVKELFKNVDIISSKYTKVIGILYNGTDIRVFKNKVELTGVSTKLENKKYYLALFIKDKVDKNYIYEVTQKINNNLHFKFGMTDLQDRMIFTACALVAQRYNPKNGLQKLKDMGYSAFHNWIYSALSKAIENDKKQNAKLDVLLEEYSVVRMAITEDQEAINNFIDNVCEIADLVNSDNWDGKDVVAIFFNEFNRYRKKADAGQIFTPDHITSFMYRLIGVSMNDKVLDATCGSGSFLVKSMCNMIKEAGGVGTEKAKKIKSEQLYGIEMYRKIYALACANMMIHKDGKTNLAQMDAKSTEASEWIKNSNITKVLMNPPYERKYGCADIVINVLDSVPSGTKCAFILPDKKIEKESKIKKALKKHTLTTIIKLPENLFLGVGVTTSIFVFETGTAQNNRNIVGYYIEDDGLETVKNKGRQDIKNRWDDIEDYWISAIQDGNDWKYNTRQIINPNEHQSYQMPEKPFEIYEEDFIKAIMDFEMYKRGIDVKVFNDELMRKILYSSDVSEDEKGTYILINGGNQDD